MTGVGNRLFAVCGVLVLLIALAGCGDDNRWQNPGSQPSQASGITLTPADNATDIAVAVEIAAKSEKGKITEVALADESGAKVSGKMREDGSSWVPDEPLKYTTKYTATATAQPEGGKAVSQKSTFTTMARPGNRVEAHIFMSDNATYGQAMPLVVEFRGDGIPPAGRATVEKRLFVTSDPPQPGVWHWDSNIQVEYRPKEYWQPGTKLKVRLGLGGLPIGDGRYGATDIGITASIDTVKRSIEVDNASKSLVATQDGQPVKTMPVSLGKDSKPSFSGTMVIIERLDKTVFDSSTYGTPVDSPDGYRTDVKFAERLTWDGQFIHAAPWSVADQGKRNVSHGCVNVSLENGQWVYNWVKIGDPVVVKGTERQINIGNGWTAWNMSWDEFVKGSALGK
jgi:lipoprotein-anchoring transpeptidase ErfK/SrfK